MSATSRATIAPTLQPRPFDAFNAFKASLTDEDSTVISEWAAAYPEIPDVPTWIDLVDALQGRREGSMHGNDRLFHTLLTIHAQGDHRAGEVVLFAMSPLIANSYTKIRHQHATHEDAVAAVTAAMWTVISTFPLHRNPDKTVANLRGDFLKHLCGAWAPQRECDVDETATDFQDYSPIALSPSTRSSLDVDDVDEAMLNPGEEAHALDVLANAVDAGAITQEETTLLLNLYLEEIPAKELAETMAITPEVLRQRKCRALRKLRKWATTSY